jgi:cytochrome P450
LLYTQAIIKETLRLYPPVWLLFRIARRDVEMGDLLIQEGEVVLAAAYILHRMAEYYPEPERFRPERFLPDENGQLLEKRIHRMAYLPFNTGPRVCIGNGFALMEGTILLATIAQQYHLQLPARFVIEPEVRNVLIPKGEVTVTLERR